MGPILKYFDLPNVLKYSKLNLTDIDNQTVIPIHVYSFMKNCRVL